MDDRKFSIIYICDGHDCNDEELPYCKVRFPRYGECNHTLNSDHAKNGCCPDPWNYPERFETYTRNNDEIVFWEK